MTAVTRLRTGLRGIAATIILLAATVGLPLALATTIGNPIRQWPSPSTGQLSDTGVIAILATVFWLAWLSFVIPAGLELALAVHARVTRRPQHHVRLPGLGAQHDLARGLISAILLLLPAASTAMTATAMPVSHQTSIPLTDTAQSAPHHPTAASTRGARRRYVIPEVGGMRSYWALAEHYLGDGARWREIWHLNEGRTHPDGTVMDSPRQLHAGWTILIPTGTDHPDERQPAPAEQVTVDPGDTLSGIATAHGISGWQQLWQSNLDRAEPDGARFTDPNLIRPGWTLTLPEPSHHASALEGTTGTHQSVPTDTARPRSEPTSIPPRHRDQPAAKPTIAPTTAPTPTAPTATAVRATPDDTATPRPAPPPHEQPQGHEDHAAHRLPAVPIGIGLAAVASVAALDRARRVAQRRRRIGHRPLPPPPPLLDVEAHLRRDARRAQPTIAAVTLAAALTGTHPVRVRAVIARRDGAVDLHLDDTYPPPPPFVAITGGWRLPAADSAFTYAATHPELPDDPCPLLLPVGTTRDGDVLINLTSTGPTSIAGEPELIDAFLRHLVTALHAAPWADRVQLHLPARLAGQLPPLDRLTSEDDRGPRPPVPPTQLAAGPDSEEPGWRTAPVHLFCGWTIDADLADVLRAAGDAHRNVHIIVTGAHPDTAIWTLDGDTLTIPGLTEPVTITRPEPAVDHDTVELLRHTATAPDVPVGDPRLPDIPGTPSEAGPASDAEEKASTNRSGVRLRLLGPVEIDGIGRLPRSQVLNLLTLLALHPRGVDRHQLLAALWPDQTVSPQTMRNRIRETRLLVEGGITDGPIWRLTDAVTTDWHEFSALATGDIDDRRRALHLIRGRPFSGLDDADWIDLGGFRSEIEATIVDTALTVAEHDLTTNNFTGALAAARAGLHASRYEERLHRIAIRAATAQGLHALAKTLAQEMRNVLDLEIEPDDQIQPETLSLIRDLHDRRPVSSDTSQR